MAGITAYISSYLGIICAAAASVSRPKSFFLSRDLSVGRWLSELLFDFSGGCLLASIIDRSVVNAVNLEIIICILLVRLRSVRLSLV